MKRLATVYQNSSTAALREKCTLEASSSSVFVHTLKALNGLDIVDTADAIPTIFIPDRASHSAGLRVSAAAQFETLLADLPLVPWLTSRTLLYLGPETI